MSVSNSEGRASRLVDRLSICNGKDFRRVVRSDFSELSESFRPSKYG